MLKSKNNKLMLPWIRYGLIPITLTLVWAVLTFWYIVIFDQSLFVISYSHPAERLIMSSHGRLLKGEKLTGDFVAANDNLGIVAIRFQAYQRVQYKDEDLLTFRIKEKGASRWYYENNYRSGFIYDMPFLPFGFPVIPNSQGKTYVFEIESHKGNYLNSVSLSQRQPLLMTKYQENKTEVLKNPKNLITFIYKKFFYSLRTIDILYSSFVFLIPLLFYLLWILPMTGNFMEKVIYKLQRQVERIGRILLGDKYEQVVILFKIGLKFGFFSIIIIIILVDILFLQILNDLIYLTIICLWLFLVKVYKYDSRNSLIMGLGFIVLASLSSLLNTTNISQKATSWGFVFFIIGLVQSLRDIKHTT